MALVRSVTFGLCLVLAGWATGPASAEQPDKIEFFEKNVRPVLAKRCYECHSAKAKKLKANLYLDSRDGARRGGTSGHVLHPGQPDQSLLIKAIRYGDKDLQMPPKGKLDPKEIAALEKWVAMGAPDPRSEKPPSRHTGKPLWSLTPPRAHPAPAVKQKEWTKSGIDRFILARLEAKGLKPVGNADRYTLIRRLYFDLIGLPPSPADIEAFAADSSPNSFERMVDRLLASPRFGERWARHWFDVARFAESSGQEFNFTYPHAWPYRDYVIDAFNADKPYNRFIQEQIAGDLLEGNDVAKTIATAFLAFGPKRHNAGRIDFVADMVDDQIDVIGRSILGLTVTCARCHDHKFDPIPSKDYYALAGIFYSTDTLFGTIQQKYSRWPTDLVPFGPNSKKLHDAVLAHRKKIDDLNKSLKESQAAQKKITKDKDKDKDKSKDKDKDPKPKSDELAKKIADLEKKIKDLKAKAPKAPTYTIAVRDSKKPVDVKINIRGNPNQLGDSVPRSFIRAIEVKGTPAVDQKTSGRRQLAEWLSHRQNPLTARVMVNRIWAKLFGRGLVGTVDNFGVLGKRPTHPELLDTLAVQFMEEGWSIKKTIRKMVLSQTYQMAGTDNKAGLQIDPDNQWLWRAPTRRLEAEVLRDAILSTSGQLDLQRPKGSSVTGLGDTLVRGIALTKLQPPSNKRSVYLPVVRDYLPEIFQLFDFPDPSLVTGKRSATTVPAQALYLRNSEFATEQANLSAKRLLEIHGLDDAGRLHKAYLLTFSRPPTDLERDEALKHVNAIIQAGGKDSRTKAWASLMQALFNGAEFRYLVDRE
jgi:hypothetical protein